ncbi:NADH:ubiquinone reductase (Na(+)-transporting) subunit D, partial [bacterium]|nr:NADH:ubiquinone reductase (Na(+)-transporting) subunit D [bacterium]
MKKNKYWETFRFGLIDENPIFKMILGICSALAVTNSVINTLTMTLAVIFVTATSSALISLIRDWIPKKVRMVVYVTIIATFVMVVDLLLKAMFPDISKALGPYVGLIITNCIIM